MSLANSIKVDPANRFLADKKRVLVLCTGNSARSQMAERLFRHETGESCEILSAGTNPTQVRLEAIAVMSEIGIDISGQRSKSVEEFTGQEFDYVITVCDHARELCPVFPGETKHLHWSIDDPARVQGSDEERAMAFRKIRDELHQRIRSFLSETVFASNRKMNA
jgi:arsenate reductase